MERDEVDDEDVPAPGGDHVEVAERAPQRPVHRAGLDRLDPQVVREHEGEDGDALVVVGAGHRAGDVPGDDGDEAGGEEAGALRPKLLRQEVGGDGGQATGER